MIITDVHPWHDHVFVLMSTGSPVLASSHTLMHTLYDFGLVAKKMFTMQGSPRLNTSVHRTQGIKKPISIPAVFDVFGEPPRHTTSV